MDLHPCAICAHAASQKCAGCKMVFYCSKEHQQQAWRKHKELCKIYQMDTPPEAITYCGLCGKQSNLVLTDCCHRSVCTNASTNKSNVLDVCARNHREYTLCSMHKKEHPDETCDWRECSKCKVHLRKTEKFVFYGTNRWNFQEDNWSHPPTFEHTRCGQCGELLKLAVEGYIEKADGTVVCIKHQQIPTAVAQQMISSRKFKVESVGIS